MKKRVFGLLFTIAAFQFGCSMDAAIFSIKPKSVLPTYEKGTGAEFVSASSGEYVATSGAVAGQAFFVKSSVGHYVPQQAKKTTGRGYIVFATVQGENFSDELVSEWNSASPTSSPSAFDP